MLIGHAEQQRAFLSAFDGERAHHAWLLAGPPGIGKAAFALAAATHRLAVAAGPADGIARDRLKVDPDHRVARLMRTPEQAFDQRPHPDFRLLERVPNEKTGKLNAQILIDQIRKVQGVFQSKPSYSDWRVVVIDSVDEVREGAANALLKTLEEPPPKTLLLLVSHAPGRLLPTIRSRCRTLRFKPLSEAEVSEVLANELPDVSVTERSALAKLAEGSPGRAMRFAGLDVAGLDAALDNLAGSASATAALSLARSLAGKTAQPRYEAFLELAPAYLAKAARQRHGAALAHTLSLWERASSLATEALPLSLDPQAVSFELATLVGGLRG
jgi:DNA polymerase III subunit delta'